MCRSFAGIFSVTLAVILLFTIPSLDWILTELHILKRTNLPYNLSSHSQFKGNGCFDIAINMAVKTLLKNF